ncbi:MAG: type II toxin-antitoxin system RelE/ParE family toxin [Phycisphaerales bacterium]|nr:type II toxin-antitoxin system RelE/ParE family toxin [Phycisphaerales bacterium]
MKRVHLTEVARSDLDEIWEYVAHDSVDRADRLVDTIAAKCRLLERFPNIGRPRPELATNLRSVPVGRYLVFYRNTDEQVEVIRVIDGFRELLPELFI